jgi:ribosomal protein S12 methylthiotransferase accessory factor
MADDRQLFYRLAAGIDVVPLTESALLLRSDTLAARIEGASATVLGERILPLLDGRRSLTEIARQLPDLGPDDLRRHLDALVEAGVADRAAHPLPSGGGDGPFSAFLQAVGRSPDEVRDRLARHRVAVVGLEGPGAHAAAALAAGGVGELVLIDPYPCQPGNLELMPPLGPETRGEPRDRACKRALEAQGLDTRVEVGAGAVTPDGLDAVTSTCQLVIGAFDRGFLAASHWLNQASLKHGVPAIYAQLAAHAAFVGPLVVPTRSACFLCWRIRAVASAKSTAEAMAHEEFVGRQHRPRLHERPALPGLAAYVGGLVAMESVKHLLSIGAETLAGKVLQFDALRVRGETHTILQVPDCPACAGERRPPTQPPLHELLGDTSPPGDMAQAAPLLVSPSCGVVNALEPMPKDPSEPTLPHLFGARVANHRLLEHRTAEDGGCGGKGLTLAGAVASALGEAVERYAAESWPPDGVLHSTRQGLDAPSLDPAELVLYRPEQYAELPYAAYSDATTLGWVPARSLVTGSSVFVPALVVGSGYYSPRAAEEVICPVSSNGLATGPTLAAAVLWALYEVLERDAFLIAWMNRLPHQRVDPATHPDPDVRGLCHAYDRRGVELRLYRPASDQPCHVFLCLAVQQGGGGPAAVAGLGADLDPARAATKAIIEAAQVRPGLRRRLRHPDSRARAEHLAEDPRRVRTIDDHALLYAHPDALVAVAFLESGREAPGDWAPTAPADPAGQLRLLVDHFRARGGDILYCNLTPPDMALLGLHTARVIVPGFQPLHFGWNEARLGGRRLYELPWRLGVTAAPTRPGDLNTDPHPLA